MNYIQKQLALTALLVFLSGAAQAQIGVTVNNNPVTFEGPSPIQENGRVLVPLRGVFEQMGANVDYNAENKTISAIRDDTKVLLTVGSREAKINDKAMTLDTPMTATDGTVFVPLRFVSEALGARVRWNAQERNVAIEAAPTTPAAEPPAAAAPMAEAPVASPPGPMAEQTPAPAEQTPTPVEQTPTPEVPATTATEPQIQSGTPAVAQAETAEQVGAENSLLRYLPWLLAALALAGVLWYLSTRNRGQVIASTKGGATGTLPGNDTNKR